MWRCRWALTARTPWCLLTTVNTRNILFICGGAFPDLEGIIKERLTKQSSIGFGADLKDKYDHDKTILEKVTVEDLRNFGMIPEFLGRLPIIFTLQGMNEDMLVKILKEPKNAILKQYQKLLALDEVKLEFEEDALTAIAKKAMEKDTGARALRAIIEEFMLDIMYEIPKDDNRPGDHHQGLYRRDRRPHHHAAGAAGGKPALRKKHKNQIAPHILEESI